MPIVSMIERASYLHARYSWPVARARISNVQGPFQIFRNVHVIGRTHANGLVKDKQGKWNATFRWRVIIFSIVDFAEEHRSSQRYRLLYAKHPSYSSVAA